MKHTSKMSLVALLFVIFSFAAGVTSLHADQVTLSGYFNDPLNPALTNTDYILGGLAEPLFGDDWEIANNVALYDLKLLVGGNVSFTITGSDGGGVDPYFTLFLGEGISATFIASNYCPAGADFDFNYTLAAGNYTLAMGVYENMSFAENLGTGTLGDGFIGIGVPGYLGDYSYKLTVTLPDQPGTPVPEPGSILLIVPGLIGLAGIGRWFRR